MAKKVVVAVGCRKGAHSGVASLLMHAERNTHMYSLCEASAHSVNKNNVTVEEEARNAYRRALRLSHPGCHCVGVAADTTKARAVTAAGFTHDEESLVNAVTSALVHSHNTTDPVQLVCSGSASIAELPLFDQPEGEEEDLVPAVDASSAGVIVPGSFNPPHEGHIALMRRAEDTIGARGAFELTALNPDKGALNASELHHRAQLLRSAGDNTKTRRTLVLSACQLFSDKARALPGVAFAVGVDTASRIVDERYYDNSPDKMRKELQVLADNNCRLLVAGRKIGNEEGYSELRDISSNIPLGLEHIFQSIPNFRVDTSSTALREQQKKPT